MPRKSQGQQPTVRQEEARLLWAVGGVRNEPTIDTWDTKADLVMEALQAILATGSTVVVRPGSGGRSVGIAIWEGDARHAPHWCYDAEEVDAWASGIMARAREMRGQAAD